MVDTNRHDEQNDIDMYRCRIALAEYNEAKQLEGALMRRAKAAETKSEETNK